MRAACLSSNASESRRLDRMPRFPILLSPHPPASRKSLREAPQNFLAVALNKAPKVVPKLVPKLAPKVAPKVVPKVAPKVAPKVRPIFSQPKVCEGVPLSGGSRFLPG